MKKAISLFLCITMIMSLFASVNFSAFAAEEIFEINEIIECEDAELSKDLEKVKDSGVSGKRYVTTSTGEKCLEPDLNNSDMTFSINIPSAGKYSVYVKHNIPSGASDSYFYWVGGAETPYGITPSLTEGFKWIKLADLNFNEGVNTFHITHRELLMSWDAIFITNDKSQLTKLDGYEIKTPETIEIPESGSVMIEAEDIYFDDTQAIVWSDEKAVGKKGVMITSGTKEIPSADADGGMDARLVAPQKGIYKIWVRCFLTKGSQDSGFVTGSDGEFITVGFPLSTDEDGYKWTLLTQYSFEAGEEKAFKIKGREADFVFDRFLITNSFETPSGEGELPSGEFNYQYLDETLYPKPTITPPPEHPRLLFTKDDIPRIAANMDKMQNKTAKEKWEAAKARNINDGVLGANNGGGNMSSSVLETIEALAFDYAVFGNKESGQKAVTAVLNMLSTVNFIGTTTYAREAGYAIFCTAEVYDWCYDLISDEDKKRMIILCESFATTMEMGWPPVGQGNVTSHACEAQLLRDFLSLAVATYDERPDIYNVCAGRILSEVVPPLDFYVASHSHHQGTTYASYRYQWSLFANYIFRAMSGKDIFSDNLGKVGYWEIYMRRPDGGMFMQGDHTSSGADSFYGWREASLFMMSNMYSDGYLKREYELQTTNMSPMGPGHRDGINTSVIFLIMNNPDLRSDAIEELPYTKYFGSPNGTMIARTGWNIGKQGKSSDVAAFMKVGEFWGGNHDHLDAGTFQLYYKGILASESGIYDSYGSQHDGNYNKQTIAHNGLLIKKPDEKGNNPYSTVSDGGQISSATGWEAETFKDWHNGSYERAKVIGHEYGPDLQYPEYSYLAGDITKAYSDKVSKVLRSMLFINTNDSEHPGVMVVMDKVVSTNKDYKKKWLLHMVQEPQVDENKSVVTNTQGDNNGRMVVETLLPKDVNIEKIGGDGKQFMVAGKNYPVNGSLSTYDESMTEYGWGRIEVSPTQANEEDYFLNVMTVSDANTAAADIESTLIEGDNYAGAVFGARAAVFAKDSADRIGDGLTFTLPEGNENYKVFVGGLKAGTWSVNGGETQIASEDGGCIYFNAGAGEVVLTYAGTNSEKQMYSSEKPEMGEIIKIKFKNNYLISDVAPTIVDGRTLVPMRVIFEALGADVSWDESSATATANLDGDIMTITENSKISYLNGNAIELDVPAQIIDGRFVVPVRFVSENFYSKVTWHDITQVVEIIPGIKPVKVNGYAKTESVKASAVSAENIAENVLDSNLETIWSAQGEHYIDFTFDREYTVDALEIILNQNANRNAIFEVLYSADGVNYTSVYSGTGDGKVGDNYWELFEFEPVTAKYFRYFAKGSDISAWNAVKEIRFREKK